MYSLFISLLPLALGVFATPAPDPVAQVTPQQTIVPFASLPTCALNCGPLYDAQGACSPPIMSASSTCFCAYGKLNPFYSGTAGVCDSACPQDPTGLSKIQVWFLGLCKADATTTTATSTTATVTTTATGTAALVSTGDSSSGTSSSSSSQTWLSTHYKYVIMVVVMAVVIVVGWIGACILKKRHDRRIEREFELRPPAAPWLAGEAGGKKAPYGDGVANGYGGSRNKEVNLNALATPANAVRVQSEKKKKEKKKWVVNERT